MDRKSIIETKFIAQNFNKYFTQIDPNLAKGIDTSTKSFNEYIRKNGTTQPEKLISVNEFKDAFFSLKINKRAGYDDISFNVVKNCFGVLHKPLLHIFNLSLQTGIFPDKLKIGRVTPLFKGGENPKLGNYMPISVLPPFSKLLEKIVYNRLYKYFTDNSILYKKQFGFQEGHSTEHAIVQLVDQIRNSFENKQYTLGVFVDLSKAFETVNHKILISKLENYEVRGKNLFPFMSCLTNQTQFIKHNNLNTSFQKSVCGVPQGLVLGSLLFLIYENDFKVASKSLDSIMFADDTNFFYSHKNIKDFLYNVNPEWNKLSQWFKANKLSITLFHKNSFKDEIPVKLPALMISNNNIERKSSIKFLKVTLDEHISWIDHVRAAEKKIQKNIGLLYRVSHFLNEDSLKTVYFSYIHSYLNYANIAWASAYATKLKRVYLKQKHAVIKLTH